MTVVLRGVMVKELLRVGHKTRGGVGLHRWWCRLKSAVLLVRMVLMMGRCMWWWWWTMADPLEFENGQQNL